MKVSVIIPVYNVERYLARCLDSVLDAARQFLATCADGTVEIICVNDGSTDGSAVSLERYRRPQGAGLSPEFSARLSFSVLTKENGGLGSARNAGLDVATGDYVMFVDSDDYILPQTIAAFARVAEASKARLVVSSSFLKDGGATPVCRSRPSDPPWRMRPRRWIAGRKVQYCAWNKFYRRDLWKDRRYPATVFEDFPTTTGIFCDLDSFAVINAPLYVYCVNPGETTLVHSVFGERKLSDSIQIIRQVYDYARGRASFAFAVRQAADGLASTISKVYKTRNGRLYTRLVSEIRLLKKDCPEVVRELSLKAKFRFRRIRRTRVAVSAGTADTWPAARVTALAKAVAADLGEHSVSLTVNGYQGYSSSAFRGVCAGGRRIFVKLGPQSSLARSRAVHTACADLPFIPKMLGTPNAVFEGLSILVTELVPGVEFERLERLNARQLEALVTGYAQFSARIQSLRAVAAPEGYYGDVDADFAVVAAFAARYPRLAHGFADLLRLCPEARSFAGREKLVLHGDFTHHNYAFTPDGLAAIYDYDILSRGLPCYELSLTVPGRYQDRHVGPWARRRLRRMFVEMVRLSPYPAEDWRLALNMQRIHWIANAIRRRPSPLRAFFCLRRFNGRLKELLRLI